MIKFLGSAFGRDCSWSAISTLHPLRQRLPPVKRATLADNTNTNVNTSIGEGENGYTNGGNHTSNASSSTEAFFGYYTTLINLVLNMLLDALIPVSISMFITMLGSLSFVNVDAFIVNSMFMFNIITRWFNYIYVMFSILIFWVKICQFMIKFPTRKQVSV